MTQLLKNKTISVNYYFNPAKKYDYLRSIMTVIIMFKLADSKNYDINPRLNDNNSFVLAEKAFKDFVKQY